MAYGDLGGPVTELVISCKDASIDGIKNGDAVALVGEYEVANDEENSDVFGQAIANSHPGYAVPVRVRGLCVFRHKQNVLWPIKCKLTLAKTRGNVDYDVCVMEHGYWVPKLTETEIHVLL